MGSKWMQFVTVLLLLGALAGLGMTMLENRSLKDRIDKLERQATVRQTAAPAQFAPSATASPTAGEIPLSGTSSLEARLAALEKRAHGAVGSASDPAPTVAPTAPAAKVVPGGAAGDSTTQTSQVSPEFKDAVLAVLKERDEQQKTRDQARGKMMAQGMAERQVNDLADKLQLSDAQKEQIAKIFREGAEKVMSQIAPMFGNSDSSPPDRKQIQQTIAQVTSEVDAQAKTLLTSEQATQYDAWRQQQNQQFGFFGGGRGIMVAPGPSVPDKGPSTVAPGK